MKTLITLAWMPCQQQDHYRIDGTRARLNSTSGGRTAKAQYVVSTMHRLPVYGASRISLQLSEVLPEDADRDADGAVALSGMLMEGKECCADDAAAMQWCRWRHVNGSKRERQQSA